MSRCLIIRVVSLLLVVSGAVRAEIQPDFLMDDNPKFRPLDPIKVFLPRTVDIWIQALQRPEIDLQRMAAETIALAHEYEMPNLTKTIPALETVLTAEASHPTARFAAARALITIESRGSSDKLLTVSQKYGSDLRHLIEPALAKWNVSAAKEIWIKRLTTSENRPRDLILAMRSLGQTQELSALPMLKSFVMDHRQATDLRLEAASVAGKLADTGLEQDAAALCHSKPPLGFVDRLCAIRLLARHASDSSRQLLIELASDAEPSIAAASLRRLNEIDPALVLPLAETAMKNADAHVRKEGAKAYLSRPNPERIGPVAMLLDDNHPEIRAMVREELFRLASNADLNDSIRNASMRVLSGNRWQGQEQASLLLGVLEHAPASMRLIELLESPRDEVMVASAWGLRKIANPMTIAGMLDKVRRQTAARKLKTTESLDLQVAHLFEACGRMRAKQAIPLMMEYVPKAPIMGERSRGAAIWALGWIYEGIPDKGVCGAFLERILDMALIPPESFLVKQQCTIALGRMKDVDHAPALRKLIEDGTPNTRWGLSLQWAVKELTAEEMPGPNAGHIGQGHWFLDPLLPADWK